MDRAARKAVVNRIRADLPREDWASWPGGWEGEIEAALIDAVFSVRARYGSESSGVRAVVQRWRSHSDGRCDDLSQLAQYTTDPSRLVAKLGNRQTLPGGLSKGEGVAQAADKLMKVRVRHADDVADATQPKRWKEQEGAWRSVHGLGPATWSYFGMLLGKPGVKPDRMIVRFISEVLGRRVKPSEASELVHGAAADLEVSATELDHAIWSYQRARS